MPRLGAAGTAYARACKPRGMGLGALPPPDTIFESIMARDEFKKNPNNVSSILWYWATIIIHGKQALRPIFRLVLTAHKTCSTPTPRMATSTIIHHTWTSLHCMETVSRRRTPFDRSKMENLSQMRLRTNACWAILLVSAFSSSCSIDSTITSQKTWPS